MIANAVQVMSRKVHAVGGGIATPVFAYGKLVLQQALQALFSQHQACVTAVRTSVATAQECSIHAAVPALRISAWVGGVLDYSYLDRVWLQLHILGEELLQELQQVETIPSGAPSFEPTSVRNVHTRTAITDCAHSFVRCRLKSKNTEQRKGLS